MAPRPRLTAAPTLKRKTVTGNLRKPSRSVAKTVTVPEIKRRKLEEKKLKNNNNNLLTENEENNSATCTSTPSPTDASAICHNTSAIAEFMQTQVKVINEAVFNFGSDLKFSVVCVFNVHIRSVNLAKIWVSGSDPFLVQGSILS